MLFPVFLNHLNDLGEFAIELEVIADVKAIDEVVDKPFPVPVLRPNGKADTDNVQRRTILVEDREDHSVSQCLARLLQQPNSLQAFRQFSVAGNLLRQRSIAETDSEGFEDKPLGDPSPSQSRRVGRHDLCRPEGRGWPVILDYTSDQIMVV